MKEASAIEEHIYNHIMLGDSCRYSSYNALAEFFSAVPEEARSLWPYDFSAEGYKTSYFGAQLFSEQLGFDRKLDLRFSIAAPQEKYTARVVLSFDDEQLQIRQESLVRDEGTAGGNFAGLFLQKQREFLNKYDSLRRINRNNPPSELLIHADSDAGRQTCGGYVWANQGFDFAGVSELLAARNEFRRFAGDRGVDLGEKDLRFFTKPCHFSAFNCGVVVRDKAGRKAGLGKAFMMEHSWFGVWKTANPDAEEKKFADIYNREKLSPERRFGPLSALNSAYLRMVRRLTEKYAREKGEHSFSAFKKYAAAKMAALNIFSR